MFFKRQSLQSIMKSGKHHVFLIGTCFSYSRFIFRLLLVLRQQHVPNGTGNADRRICPCQNTDHHRQCKFFQCRHTQYINGPNGEECGQGCIDGTCQCLTDALVDFFRCLVCVKGALIFLSLIHIYAANSFHGHGQTAGNLPHRRNGKNKV